jgi:hypothetical protein
MWKKKDSENIIYLDNQLRLQIPPTIFADNTKTPFKDNTFDTIFYDPPHRWAWEGSYFSFPNVEEAKEIWGDKGGVITYYGWDIFKTREDLIRHLYNASNEFYRILKDDGLLWLKWNEIEINISQVLSLFGRWDELLRLYVKSPMQRKKDVQTYWICLSKKKEGTVQSSLHEFKADEELPVTVLQRGELGSNLSQLRFGSSSNPKVS